MRLCLDLIRQIQPDLLVNQHRRQAFRLEPDMLDELEQVLIERDRITEELTGRSAGWAWDDAWCRAYPFEQTAQPGAVVTVAVHITNHDAKSLPVSVEPVLPAGCRVTGGSPRQKGAVPPLTAGSCLAESDPDLSLEWKIALPADADQATLPLIFRISCRIAEGPAALGWFISGHERRISRQAWQSGPASSSSKTCRIFSSLSSSPGTYRVCCGPTDQ
jgi:hypothetical protein